MVNQTNNLTYTPDIGDYEQSEYHIVWEAGELSWLLQPHQDVMYDDIWSYLKDTDQLTYTINCSRRFGKTFTLLLAAVEFCLKKPDRVVRFAMPFSKEARSIIRVQFKTILETCPTELRPNFKAIDSYWAFTNGSELHIHGVNNGHEDNLRGHAADLAIVDEAGQVDELKYVINDILRPQLLTTNGKMLVASTPPPIPGHHYRTVYNECKLKNALSEYTIYDNTSIDKRLIEKYKEEAGGENSATWKREYLCKFEVDLDRLVIPEWRDDFIQEYPRPELFPFLQKYMSMDLGVINDFTAAIFGYYDFENAILIIEDEVTSHGSNQTTELLHGLLSSKETELEYSQMRKRIADNNNPQLLNDLAITYKYHTIPVSKKTLMGMVNALRVWIAQERLIVHPRCTMLIGNLQNAFWDVGNNKDKNSNRPQKFGRNETYRHFDHLSALIYLIRMIDQQTNPIPLNVVTDRKTQHIPREIYNQSDNKSFDNLAGAFKIKNK